MAQPKKIQAIAFLKAKHNIFSNKKAKESFNHSLEPGASIPQEIEGKILPPFNNSESDNWISKQVNVLSKKGLIKKGIATQVCSPQNEKNLKSNLRANQNDPEKVYCSRNNSASTSQEKKAAQAGTRKQSPAIQFKASKHILAKKRILQGPMIGSDDGSLNILPLQEDKNKSVPHGTKLNINGVLKGILHTEIEKLKEKNSTTVRFSSFKKQRTSSGTNEPEKVINVSIQNNIKNVCIAPIYIKTNAKCMNSAENSRCPSNEKKRENLKDKEESTNKIKKDIIFNFRSKKKSEPGLYDISEENVKINDEISQDREKLIEYNKLCTT